MKLVVLLILAGCACVVQEAPVIVGHTYNRDDFAETLCSANGLPFIVVDSEYAEHAGGVPEIIYIHEQVHVRQMTRHKGGCRAFNKKYNTDKTFRMNVELEAYCEAEKRIAWKRSIPDSVRNIYKQGLYDLLTARYGAKDPKCRV